MNSGFEDLLEIDLNDPYRNFPQRSVLAALQPIGIGTPYVESLTSYLQRLADLHCVSPKVLSRELVLPRIGLNNREQKSQADRFWSTSFFCGMGEVPAKWVNVLEELTSVKGLHQLTLLPLSGRISTPEWAAPMRQWCPCCLEESAREGLPYGQLLWEIERVNACPKHGVKLVHGCDCDLAQAPSSLRRKYLPHLCGICGKSLLVRAGIQTDPATQENIEDARFVADLIGGPLFQVESASLPKADLATFLQQAVQEAGGGNAAKLARMMRVSKGTINGWLHRHHLPCFPLVIMIARIFHVSITEVITGRFDQAFWLERPDDIPDRRTHWRFMRKLPSESQEALLQSVMDAEPAPSLAETARLMGTSCRELRRKYPVLSRAIVKRALAWKSEEAARRRKDRLWIVEKTAKRLASEGLIPTQRRVEARLQGVPRTFLFQERQACRQIFEKARMRMPSVS